MATQYPLHYIEFIQKLSVFFTLKSLSIYAKPLLKQLPTNFNQAQLDLLQQSYDALQLQTLLKPILDQMNLVIDANGISSNFSQSYTSLFPNAYCKSRHVCVKLKMVRLIQSVLYFFRRKGLLVKKFFSCFHSTSTHPPLNLQRKPQAED